MKTIFCLFSLAFTSSLFAASPDSLSGKVYRSYSLLSGRTNAVEGTLVLGTDGRYLALKSAFGVIATPHADGVLPDAHWGGIETPPPDGRYRYEKIGATTGVLTLLPDGATTESSTTLLFSSLTTGSTSPNGLRGLGGNAFHLTELSAQNSAPISNVSLRGRVAEGRPLIMGFVVPGTTEREVLIRVIGPTLASLGVTGAWASSSLQLFRGNSALFGDSFRFPFWSVAPTGIYFTGNSSPEAGLRKIFDYVGAFPLPSGSKDSAVVVRLAPGNCSVVASASPGDAGGEALIEFYALP